MIQVVWRFIVKPRAVDKFERAYGAQGSWARLFRSHPGYCGTILLRDIDHPRSYLTIDFWETAAHRERMLRAAQVRYSALDKSFADLTESEHEIGTFALPVVTTERRRSKARPRRADQARRGNLRRRT